MAGYRIISADSHVVEPDDLWLNRIEPEFKAPGPACRSHRDWRRLLVHWRRQVSQPRIRRSTDR